MKFLKTLSLFALSLVLLVACGSVKPKEEEKETSPPVEITSAMKIEAFYNTITATDNLALTMVDSYNTHIVGDIDEGKLGEATTAVTGLSGPLLVNALMDFYVHQIDTHKDLQENTYYLVDVMENNAYIIFAGEDNNITVTFFLCEEPAEDATIASIPQYYTLNIEYDYENEKPISLQLIILNTVVTLNEDDENNENIGKVWEYAEIKINFNSEVLNTVMIEVDGITYQQFISATSNEQLAPYITKYNTETIDNKSDGFIRDVFGMPSSDFFTNEEHATLAITKMNEIRNMDFVGASQFEIILSSLTDAVDSEMSFFEGLIYSMGKFSIVPNEAGMSLALNNVEGTKNLLNTFDNKITEGNDTFIEYQRGYLETYKALEEVSLNNTNFDAIKSKLLAWLESYDGNRVYGVIEFDDYQAMFFANRIVVLQANDDEHLYAEISLRTEDFGEYSLPLYEYNEVRMPKKEDITFYQNISFTGENIDYLYYETKFGYNEFLIELAKDENYDIFGALSSNVTNVDRIEINSEGNLVYTMFDEEDRDIKAYIKYTEYANGETETDEFSYIDPETTEDLYNLRPAPLELYFMVQSLLISPDLNSFYLSILEDIL